MPEVDPGADDGIGPVHVVGAVLTDVPLEEAAQPDVPYSVVEVALADTVPVVEAVLGDAAHGVTVPVLGNALAAADPVTPQAGIEEIVQEHCLVADGD